MDHTVENKHFPGVFEATPLRAPVRPWGHAPRQANPVLTQGRRGAQGRDTPPPITLVNHSEKLVEYKDSENFLKAFLNASLAYCTSFLAVAVLWFIHHQLCAK